MAGEARANKKFEPLHKWNYEEDRDILEIQLQGFKKEQLRVQLSNSGILKIFGERPNASKEAEFHIEITLPSNTYLTQAIHAKFQYGHLYITIPKINRETNGNISSEPSKIHQELPKDQSTKVPPTPPSHDRISGVTKEQTPKQEVPKDQSIVAPPPPPLSHGSISGDEVQQMLPSGENTLPEFDFHGHNPLVLGLRVGEMAVSLAATAAAIVVLVAYVVYMYKSTFDGV
ncbi:hypothetical protein OROMI_002214 [Orobanche minor]